MKAQKIEEILRPGQTWVNHLDAKMVIGSLVTDLPVIGMIFHATRHGSLGTVCPALVTAEGLSDYGYELHDTTEGDRQ